MFFPLFILAYYFVPICSEIDTAAQPVVIHCEDKICEVGFGGDYEPRESLPAVVGRPKQNTPAIGKKQFVGNEINDKDATLNLSYPINNGIVKNWDDFEILLHHIFFTVLRVEPAEHSVLLSESPSNAPNKRKKTVQMLFETYHVPGMYLANTDLLKWYTQTNSVWVGGSNLASSAAMQNKWISADDYDENGPEVIERQRAEK